MTEWVTEIEGEMDGVDEPVYDWETLGVDETECVDVLDSDMVAEEHPEIETEYEPETVPDEHDVELGDNCADGVLTNESVAVELSDTEVVMDTEVVLTTVADTDGEADVENEMLLVELDV